MICPACFSGLISCFSSFHDLCSKSSGLVSISGTCQVYCCLRSSNIGSIFTLKSSRLPRGLLQGQWERPPPTHPSIPSCSFSADSSQNLCHLFACLMTYWNFKLHEACTYFFTFGSPMPGAWHMLNKYLWISEWSTILQFDMWHNR